MEMNEDPLQKDTNQTVLRLVTGIFSRPYLPASLIVFLSILIFTDYAYVLMREPKIYWFDYSREAVRPIGGFNYGPLVALGEYLIYVALVWVTLRVLNRKFSVVLWSGLVVLHLSAYILVPPTCGYDAQQIFPSWFCHINTDLITFILGAILGLVFARSVFYDRSNSNDNANQNSIVSKLGLTRLGILASVAWLTILGTGIGFASRIPTEGWKPVLTEHAPSPSHEMMIAYDVERSQAILFGGVVETSENNWTKINETWSWNGKDWTQLFPQQSPPARARGAMAFDPKRKVIILFGGWDNLGKSLNDTWEWDGSNWKQVGDCESCYPPPSRGCHSMFYDTSRGSVILYGGCNEYQTFYNDTWGWDGSKWEYIENQGSPVASGSPIIYESTNQRAIGFLAWQPSGTWIWDTNGWAKQAFAVEPPLRGNSALAYDPNTGNSLLFGGTKTENNFTTFYQDTWVINGQTWRELPGSLQPPGRWGHMLFFDPALKKFILFGGFDGTTGLNDTWEISLPATK